MKRDFTFIIEEKDQGLSIKSFLTAKGFSKSVLVHLKKTPESILLNGTWEYVTKKLSPGDTLTIHLVEDTSSCHIPPVYHPLAIVYEDEDILVINKPAHMPIHPSLNNYENTLGNAVAYYYQAQGIPFTYRCINRLDRDTTGLTIIAKHMVSAGILSQMQLKREIHRDYLAIVEGVPPTQGCIDAPIGRVADSVIVRQVDFQHGERAVTHFHTLTSQNGYSLVHLQLETGRTHQIRVHMKHLGYPLIGDFLYHPQQAPISRQALHSYRLTFPHPITQKKQCFFAPLPEDMASLFPYLCNSSCLI